MAKDKKRPVRAKSENLSPTNGNGKSGAAPQPASARAMRPREVRQDRMSQTFAQVVAVLMRDRNFRNMKLADLEWLVIPPILAGQWKLGQTSAPPPPGQANVKAQGGVVVPVAVLLWATVSPAVDKRLSENLDAAMVLKPGEWASGDIIWLIVAGGDPAAVPKFIKQLAVTDFKGKQVKMRVAGPGGKPQVQLLKTGA